MSQFDFSNLTSPLPGSTLIDDVLEPWRDALNSQHSGPSRPAYAVPGMMWVNNSTNPWIVNIFDGSQDIAVGTVNTATNVFTPNLLGACLLAANNLSDLADAAAARTNLGLGTLATKNQVSSSDLDSSVNFAPSGAVLAFAMATPPSGWLECNGASVLRATYPALFSAIGTAYGSVDGTHFTLPDLRGEFIRGWDHARGVDTSRAIGSAQADELKSHTHTAALYNSVANNNFPCVGAGGNTGTLTTSATGGSETRPRNIAMMYCIKT